MKIATADYTTTITVEQSAATVFNAINNVGGWWTENMEGHSQKLNDVFTVHFGETFITIKIVDLITDKKITWQVIDCYKHWLKNKKEWQDTAIEWEIKKLATGTQLNFTHIGLVPGIECYDGCENAWNGYITKSLFNMLNEGKGQPGVNKTP